MRKVSCLGWMLLVIAMSVSGAASHSHTEEARVVYEGFDGPGKGRHVVLISGDEEYRSEEAMPQLGKILATRHGFKCTVLFSVNPEDGTIDPGNKGNIPGLEALKTADLMVIFTRFRDLPDEQMKQIAAYLKLGRPVVGLRTATHAFDVPVGKTYSRFSFNSREWDGGFGRQVLGETWISHHGNHGVQSTRGVIAPGMQAHPVVLGIKDGEIYGPTDVYEVRLPLPEGCRPLVMGQVLEGMKRTDPVAAGRQNDPMMPVAWVKTYAGASGHQGRVFTTTMGCSQELLSEGFRRLLVNACYWAVGLEDRIAPHSPVGLVGEYEPSPFGFGKFKKGMRPADHAL